MSCYNKQTKEEVKNLNPKGITLVSLIITIIVLLIIAGITTTAGIESIQTAKKTSMITELEIIQEKVNIIYEKRATNIEDKQYYDALGQDISVVEPYKLTEVLKETSQEGYRYFSKEDLKKLDLDNITQDVIINFNTRDVVSIEGILVDNQRYYRLADIPNYPINKIEYIDKNTQAPSFDVEVNKIAEFWQIRIKDITYNSNVEGGSLSYKLKEQQNWIIIGNTNHFQVRQPRFI